jgi:thiol-disulfide isomerase/thioredoxin
MSLAAPTLLAVLALAPVGDFDMKSLSHKEFAASIAKNDPAVKLVMVDAWATYCPPCKENFPHLVQMHHEYGPKGLRVISLSLDDPEDEAAVAAARKFLVESKAAMENVLMAEEFGVPFEKFDINAIPAVFFYDATGREVKRFTLDDPNNQFTYDDVEAFARDYLAGKGKP